MFLKEEEQSFTKPEFQQLQKENTDFATKFQVSEDKLEVIMHDSACNNYFNLVIIINIKEKGGGISQYKKSCK